MSIPYERISRIRNQNKRQDCSNKTQNARDSEKSVTDSLWPEIETLNWVLNEILVLNRGIDDR